MRGEVKGPRVGRHSFSYILAFLGFLILLLILAWALDVIGIDQDYTLVGPLSAFPPADHPYAVEVGDKQLWVVNDGNDLIVFENGSPAIPMFSLNWNPATHQFEDLISGSTFAPDGRHLQGPATRDLSRFAHIIMDGDLYVDLSEPSPGSVSLLLDQILG